MRVNVQVAVRTNNEQKPWINSSITGEFYFKELKREVVNAKVESTGKGYEANKLQQETLLWETIKDSADPEMYQAYLEQFPKGIFTAIAGIKLEALSKSAKTTETTKQLKAPEEKVALEAEKQRLAKERETFRKEVEEERRLAARRKALQ